MGPLPILPYLYSLVLGQEILVLQLWHWPACLAWVSLGHN